MKVLGPLLVSLVAFWFAASADAHAENWIIYKNADAAYGWDADTLKPGADGRITSVYATYSASALKLDELSYHYGMIGADFDCATRSMRINEAVVLDADAKLLKTIVSKENTPWKPIDETKSVQGIVFGIACLGKTAPAGGIAAGDMTSALAKMKGGG